MFFMFLFRKYFLQADGGVEDLVGEVVVLRKELDTFEKLGNASVAEAKHRLAETNERATDMLEEMLNQEVIASLIDG